MVSVNDFSCVLVSSRVPSSDTILVVLNINNILLLRILIFLD